MLTRRSVMLNGIFAPVMLHTIVQNNTNTSQNELPDVEKPTVFDNPIPMRAPLRLFFPSDAKQPHETMLQWDGQIIIIPEPGGYEEKLCCGPTPYKESNGDPTAIRLRPVVRNSDQISLQNGHLWWMQQIYSVLDADTASVTPIHDKIIAWHVRHDGPWVLDFATWHVFDKNNVYVARFSIPILIPAKL